MMTNEPTRAKKIFARTCIAICVGIVAFPAIARWVKDRPVDYDYEASIAKLKKIGAALQLYRAEYGVKPVAERRNYSDAGLPLALHALAQPGHAWTVEGGIRTFKLDDVRYDRDNPISFAHLYWDPTGYEQMFDLTDFFGRRGEAMPILADFNPHVAIGRPPEEHPKANAVVLRLDGTVHVVEYDRLIRRDIYEK